MYNKKWSRLEDFNLLYLKLYKTEKHSDIGNKIKRSFTSVQTRASFLKKKLEGKYGFPSPNDFKEWNKVDIMQWLINVNDGEKWGLNMSEYFSKPKKATKEVSTPVTEISKQVNEASKSFNTSDISIPSDTKVVIITSGNITVNNK